MAGGDGGAPAADAVHVRAGRVSGRLRGWSQHRDQAVRTGLGENLAVVLQVADDVRWDGPSPVRQPAADFFRRAVESSYPITSTAAPFTLTVPALGSRCSRRSADPVLPGSGGPAATGS